MTKFECLEKVWSYLQFANEPAKADIIIGFGCADKSVALRAATLYQEGWAPYLLFSGGLGKGTDGFFQKPEADIFVDIALGLGVPKEAILSENRSRNTGENIAFSRELLRQRGIAHNTIMVVHQPNMGRRIFAALMKQWEGPTFIIAPRTCTLVDYMQGLLDDGMEEEEIYNNIVGDFQRIDVYAKQGYQIPQEIPADAVSAYHQLIGMGYTKYQILPHTPPQPQNAPLW